MTAIQPLSSAPISGLIWEIDDSATTIFGESPLNYSPAVPPVSNAFGKRLSSIFDHMRSTVWPSILDSLNTTQITYVRRAFSADSSDPLDVDVSETTTAVYAAVMGASIQNIERGFITASDYEALIAAASLGFEPVEDDAIRFGGTTYDLIGFQAFPQVPPAVAYRIFLRRAA